MWCLGFWLHVEGFNTPTFDADGFVTGQDTLGTMISDMSELLDVAQSQNIIVIFSLFNVAVMKNKKMSSTSFSTMPNWIHIFETLSKYVVLLNF